MISNIGALVVMLTVVVSCEHCTVSPGVTKAGTWLSRGAPDNQRYLVCFLVIDCAPHQEDHLGSVGITPYILNLLAGWG